MTAPDRIWCHPTERQPVPAKDRRNAKWVRGRWKDHDSKASGDVEYIRADLAVTVGVKDFDIEVVRGNTGGNLALYFNDYRVAGSKPWGGGTTIHKFRVQGDDAKSSGILATIWDFQTVPVVKECLTTDAALPAVTQPAPEHVNEMPKTEHDAGNVLTNAAAIRAAALREAVEILDDEGWLGMSKHRILALIDKEPGNG